MVDPKALYESDDVAWLGKPDREVETSWVERKESFHKDEIARQISAFANGQPPGGLIVVGASSNGTIKGLGNLISKVNDQLSKIPIDECGLKHRFVDAGENRQLLYVFVPFSSTRVVSLSDGTAYVRKGSSTIELRSQEIQELRYQRGEISFEDEPIVRFSLDLIEPTIAQEFLRGVVEKNGLSLPLTFEEAIGNKKLSVMSGNEAYLTVAGILAVGARPTDFISGARVHFQRFEGTEERFGTERNVSKERWFEGPTKNLLRDIEALIGTLLRDFDFLGPCGTFVTEPEYPKTTWEEALVNAIVHRSYSIKNTPVDIRMFDDRLEVESPGGYPGPNRPDAKGVFQRSYPRNPHLAEALRYLEVVRLAKEGTRRMSQEMSKLGLPAPEYSEPAGGAVRVILRNDIERRRRGSPKENEWAEVARLLKEDLAVYRRSAYDKWSALYRPGMIVPPETMAEVDRVLRAPEPRVSVDEKNRLLYLVQALPEPATVGLVKSWAEALDAAPLLPLAHDQLRSIAAGLLARSDEAVETILKLLESARIAFPEARKLAYDTLTRRLSREPLPPRDWTERVLQVCRQHPTDGSSLYYHITGAQVPKQ